MKKEDRQKKIRRLFAIGKLNMISEISLEIYHHIIVDDFSGIKLFVQSLHDEILLRIHNKDRFADADLSALCGIVACRIVVKYRKQTDFSEKNIKEALIKVKDVLMIKNNLKKWEQI